MISVHSGRKSPCLLPPPLDRTAGKRKPALIEKDAQFIGTGHPEKARSRVQFLCAFELSDIKDGGRNQHPMCGLQRSQANFYGELEEEVGKGWTSGIHPQA